MRFVIIILFIISTTYAGAIIGAALVIAVNAIVYIYSIISSGFDLTLTGNNFAALTAHFGSMSDAAKIGALCPGLLLGLWGAWQAMVKGVNPFYYTWKRTKE